MQLRIMSRADIPAGMKLRETAGWNQTEVDWKRFLDASPQGCFVAEVEGQVCGTVTTIVYEGRFAWVGMVLVTPEQRGRGIGTKLLLQAIEYLDGAGVATIKLDATPEGKPIYEKLGFVTEYEIERWALKRRGTLAPGEVSGDLQVGEAANLEEILAADRAAFGADRSALLRSLHHHAPELSGAVYAEGSLAGYTLGRRGSRADHLGPWTARNEDAARQLLGKFLAHSKREMIFVDAMKPNPFALRLIRSAGFEFSRPLTRMVRGPNAFPGRPEYFCAILGPEFG